MTYVQNESQTNQLSRQRVSKKWYRFSKPVQYDKRRVFVLGWKSQGRVDSYLDPAKIYLSIYLHVWIIALFLMTLQLHFLFSFPEETGSIDFLLMGNTQGVHNLFSD